MTTNEFFKSSLYPFPLPSSTTFLFLVVYGQSTMANLQSFRWPCNELVLAQWPKNVLVLIKLGPIELIIVLCGQSCWPSQCLLNSACSEFTNHWGMCSQVNVDNDSRLFRVGWLVARANHISCGPFTDWPCSIITPLPFQSLCACVFTTDKWSNCFELQFHEIGWPNYRHLHAALHWHGPIGECHNWEEQHKQWEEMNKDDTPLLQFSSV